MITNDFSWVSTFLNLWKPECAIPALVFVIKIHICSCKLCVVSLVHLQPWLSLHFGITKKEVVTLLDAVLDYVKLDFSLLFVKSSQVLCDCANISKVSLVIYGFVQ